MQKKRQEKKLPLDNPNSPYISTDSCDPWKKFHKTPDKEGSLKLQKGGKLCILLSPRSWLAWKVYLYDFFPLLRSEERSRRSSLSYRPCRSAPRSGAGTILTWLFYYCLYPSFSWKCQESRTPVWICSPFYSQNPPWLSDT